MGRIEVTVYQPAEARHATEAAGAATAGTAPDGTPLAPALPKPRYTRGLRIFQRSNNIAMRASARVAQAVADGLSEYVRRSRESARSRKDGALVDMPINWARALKSTLRTSSGLPVDFARMIPRRLIKKQVRFWARLSPFRFER